MLLRWYGDAGSPHFWNLHRRILTYRGFLEQLQQMLNSTELRVICQLPSREPIGYCQTYSIRSWDGWAYVTMFLTPEHRYGEEPVEAAILGVDAAFSAHPLRKIYSDVYGFSSYLQAALETIGFSEEGITPNHYWFNDQFWARLRLALYREQWQELRARADDATA